jgi:tetratricopeptide (TPR) repeat protein
MIPGENSSYGVTIAVLVGWIASVCLHEFGHAIVAYYGGDITVKDKGYLTLNPLKYTDIGYSLVMPVMFLMLGGIALPGAAVYIHTSLLRNRVWQSAVSAAGPFMTGLVALALALPFQFGWATDNHWIWYALALLASLQVAGLCFNLLPIPSFDGFGIIEPWLPKSMQVLARRWDRYGYLFLIGMLWFVPDANRAFWAVAGTLSNWLGIPDHFVTSAYLSFREPSKLLFIGLVVAVLVFRKAFKSNDQAKDLQETQEAEVTLAAYDQAIDSGLASDQIWLAQGQLLSHLNRDEEAIANYDRALQLTPHNPELQYARGVAFQKLGRYEEALEEYEKSQAVWARDADVWFNKASILVYLSQTSKADYWCAAITAFDQSLKYRPHQPSAWMERGHIFYRLGQYRDAVASYEKSLNYQPQNPEAWDYCGGAQLRLNELDKALRCFQNLFHHDPQNISALMHQISILRTLGQTQKIPPILEQAQKLCSDEPECLVHRASLLFYRKDYDGAIALFDECLTHNIQADMAHYNKACCYALQGKSELALASLQSISTDEGKQYYIKEAQTDPDLQSLHELDSFQSLICKNG